MRRKLRKKSGPDLDQFLSALNKAQLGANYTETDRYREFKAVFLGTDAGKRVLHQILAWGHMYASDFDVAPTAHAFAAGERNLALKIFAAIHTEPAVKPVKQTTKREPNA